MRDEIVPDRLGFRISVDENDGHREFLPKQKSVRTTVQSKALPRTWPLRTVPSKCPLRNCGTHQNKEQVRRLATAGIGGARTLGSSGFPTRQGQKQSCPVCRLLALRDVSLVRNDEV